MLASYVPGRVPEDICEPVTAYEAAYVAACKDRINDLYRAKRAAGLDRATAMRDAFDEVAVPLLTGAWSPEVKP